MYLNFKNGKLPKYFLLITKSNRIEEILLKMTTRNNLRNIAIIAHVDHGKTTLVDQLLSLSTTLDSHNELEDRVMDSDALEKERGITILSDRKSVV